MLDIAHGLGRKILDVAGKHEGRLALSAREETLVYGELISRAAKLAQTLLDVGAGERESRVAILCDRSCDAYTAIIAALLVGAAYMPLNPRFPVERNRKILASTSPVAMIVDAPNAKDLPGILSGLETPVIVVASGPEALQLAPADIPMRLPAVSAGDMGKLGPRQEPDELAYLLFTSGSTGAPKGAPIGLGNLDAYIRSATALTRTNETSRILQSSDLTFDISVHDMFIAWTNGAALFSVPENATMMATRFVEEHEITCWYLVPSTAALLKQAGLLLPGVLDCLRFTIFGGESLTSAVVESWRIAAPSAKIINVYGPTEAAVAISSFVCMPDNQHYDVMPLGHTFPGQAMELFDSNGEATQDTGEICLSGSQVMKGYWKAPKLNHQRFFEAAGRRWYRTGDIGRYHPTDGILFAGRTDHQIKLRGFRVELQEIENALRDATGRDLVAVLPWPITPEGADGCVAFVAGAAMDTNTILAACRTRLPDYMIPGRVFFIEQLPFNTNGKVDYRQLAKHPLLTIVG